MASLGRSSDAIAVFTALTADFPNLAEPYNNLAVLHAAARDYDRARVALEKAIRVAPDYATAHENLGDLYLQLANQAYAKVVQLAPDNANAKLRQSLLANINGQKVGKAPPRIDQKTGVSAEQSEKEAVLSVVHKWTQAWSARNVPAYLNYYAAEFRTPNREPRPVWENKRRALIEGKAKIEVTVESPQVSLNDRIATVKYRQIYVSDNYSSKDRKTLVLRKDDADWKIIEERDGS
jgi:tetratricopeptide (TPR) repeat protein